MGEDRGDCKRGVGGGVVDVYGEEVGVRKGEGEEEGAGVTEKVKWDVWG